MKLEPKASIFTPDWANCPGFHGQFCCGWLLSNQSSTWMLSCMQAHANCCLSRACWNILDTVADARQLNTWWWSLFWFWWAKCSRNLNVCGTRKHCSNIETVVKNTQKCHFRSIFTWRRASGWQVGSRSYLQFNEVFTKCTQSCVIGSAATSACTQNVNDTPFATRKFGPLGGFFTLIFGLARRLWGSISIAISVQVESCLAEAEIQQPGQPPFRFLLTLDKQASLNFHLAITEDIASPSSLKEVCCSKIIECARLMPAARDWLYG